MRIGLDIDNVISNFNEALLEEYKNHDKKLRNHGIINKDAYFRKMFDWTLEEEISFYDNNIERIAKSLKTIDGAKEYIDKLKQDGHLIYIITGRDNGEYSNPYDMTKEWLKQNKVYYDKIIFTNAYNSQSKAEACVKNNIDIMIDDSISMCTNCIAKGIKTFIMDTQYNKKANIPRVHNWKEIYEVIKNEEKNNS